MLSQQNYAPINCLPHLPHLGWRWGNGKGYVKKIWSEEGGGWGKCHVYQMKLVGVRGGIWCPRETNKYHAILLSYVIPAPHDGGKVGGRWGIWHCRALPSVPGVMGPLQEMCAKSPPSTYPQPLPQGGAKSRSLARLADSLAYVQWWVSRVIGPIARSTH